jgi:hypothetical protein
MKSRSRTSLRKGFLEGGVEDALSCARLEVLGCEVDRSCPDGTDVVEGSTSELFGEDCRADVVDGCGGRASFIVVVDFTEGGW